MWFTVLSLKNTCDDLVFLLTPSCRFLSANYNIERDKYTTGKECFCFRCVYRASEQRAGFGQAGAVNGATCIIDFFRPLSASSRSLPLPPSLPPGILPSHSVFPLFLSTSPLPLSDHLDGQNINDLYKPRDTVSFLLSVCANVFSSLQFRNTKLATTPLRLQSYKNCFLNPPVGQHQLTKDFPLIEVESVTPFSGILNGTEPELCFFSTQS